MIHTSENLVLQASAEPIVLADIPNPAPGSAEAEAADVRRKATHDISAMPWLPQLPDQWMGEVYDRLFDAERNYAAPNLLQGDYLDGTATEEDSIVQVTGPGDMLFAAVHATKTRRKDPANPVLRKIGFPDTGTAALASVLAEDFGRAFIMNGRQTGNAAVDEEHPIKKVLMPHIPAASGFLDVHGCASHLFTDPRHRFNVHASVGLGLDPDDTLRDLAHTIMRYGRSELGLHVIIGNDQEYYSQQNPALVPKRNADGTAYRHRLAALKPTMLTNVVRAAAARQGHYVPTMQIELAGINRLTALDDTSYPKNEKSRVVGAALGYQLMRYATEQLESLGRQTNNAHGKVE